MCGMSFYMARAIALTFVVASGGYAQTLNIWPGVAPGSETWTQKEKIEKSTPIGAVVFNVVTPTLTPYLPERSKATGTGIIIAPGGAFVALAIDLEGHDVARWLQNKGTAAFLLKYRITEKRQERYPRFEYLVRIHFEEHKNHHAGDRNVEPNGKRETRNSPVHCESAGQREKERREHHRQREHGKDYVAG